MNLRKLFLEYCEVKQFEINEAQLSIIDDLKNFHEVNFKQTYFTKIFKKKT